MQVGHTIAFDYFHLSPEADEFILDAYPASLGYFLDSLHSKVVNLKLTLQRISSRGNEVYLASYDFSDNGFYGDHFELELVVSPQGEILNKTRKSVEEIEWL